MSKRLTLFLLGLVFVASGAYCIIYLVRWEWHRAIIAGLFFIGAEVAVVGRTLTSRLRSLERRLDSLAAVGPAHADVGREAHVDPEVRSRLRETAPAGRKHFAWLARDGEHMNVFLPVLLGTGLVASALAWLVEQLARATARPVLENDLAHRLAPIAWPAGGLLGEEQAPDRRRGWRLPKLARMSAVAVLVVGFAFGFEAVEDALETRPDHREQGVQTAIELRFSGRRLSYGPEATATDLWAMCKIVLGRQTPSPEVTALDARRVRLLLDADLGRHAGARLRGCLEDAHIDHLQAGVVSVTRYVPPVLAPAAVLTEPAS